MVAASNIVVGDYIVHETCVTAIYAGCSTSLFPFGHAHGHHALVALAVENSLNVGTLALPCMDCGAVLLCSLRNFVQLVVNVARCPCGVKPIGKRVP